MTHFVDVVHLDHVVKEAVEVVEEGHHLHRRADGAHGREAHDVGEEDGHRLIALRLHGRPRHQLIGDVPASDESTDQVRDAATLGVRCPWLRHRLPRQHAGEELVGAGLLCRELIGPLLHHVFQVIGIFLQLCHHVVQYIRMTAVTENNDHLLEGVLGGRDILFHVVFSHISGELTSGEPSSPSQNPQNKDTWKGGRPYLSGLQSLSCRRMEDNGGRWSGFSFQQAFIRELMFSSQRSSDRAGRRSSLWKGVRSCVIISAENARRETF